jgi:AcrR family transcriptional regulator
MDAGTDLPTVSHTARGKVIRNRIVDAAVRLVSEHGVNRTRVDDVRDAAGVSGSQMSHYFRDKNSLIRAVIARQSESMLAIHGHSGLGDLDSLDALYRWADVFLDQLRRTGCRGGCAFGSLAAELIGADGGTRTDLAEGFDQWAGLLRRGLVAMRDRGDLTSEADPEVLALGLLSVLQGGALLAQLRRDVEPVRASLNAMLARVRSFASDESVRSSTRRVPVTAG